MGKTYTFKGETAAAFLGLKQGGKGPLTPEESALSRVATSIYTDVHDGKMMKASETLRSVITLGLPKLVEFAMAIPDSNAVKKPRRKKAVGT
jgi:hypothetical protein